MDGACGLAPVTRFDTTGFPVKLAGEVRHEAPERWLDRRLLVATDRWTQFGMIAAHHALAEAGIDLAEIDSYRVAMITAAASGGNEFGQREIQSLWSSGPRAVSVYQSIAWFYAATTGQISIRHGSKAAIGRGGSRNREPPRPERRLRRSAPRSVGSRRATRGRLRCRRDRRRGGRRIMRVVHAESMTATCGPTDHDHMSATESAPTRRRLVHLGRPADGLHTDGCDRKATRQGAAPNHPAMTGPCHLAVQVREDRRVDDRCEPRRPRARVIKAVEHP